MKKRGDECSFGVRTNALLYSALLALIVMGAVFLLVFFPYFFPYSILRLLVYGSLMSLPNFFDMLLSYLTVNRGVNLSPDFYYLFGFLACLLLFYVVRKGYYSKKGIGKKIVFFNLAVSK